MFKGIIFHKWALHSITLIGCTIWLTFLSLEAKPIIIATHSILGEWVAQVGGADIELNVLVPPESDTHTFEPTPDHAVALNKADLIFENGLHLEEPWLSKLIVASQSMGKRIPVGSVISSISEDPHIWLNVDNAIHVIKLIETTLATQDPDHAKGYQERAQRYEDRLKELENWIQATVSPIPLNKRKFITYHDNFGHFAKAYNFNIPGTILSSNTTDTADPAAKQFASLIKLIKKEEIQAIFTDAMSNSTLPEQVARETYLPAPYILYDDALGKPGSSVDSYEKLMRYNVLTIVNALK